MRLQRLEAPASTTRLLVFLPQRFATTHFQASIHEAFALIGFCVAPHALCILDVAQLPLSSAHTVLSQRNDALQQALASFQLSASSLGIVGEWLPTASSPRSGEASAPTWLSLTSSTRSQHSRAHAPFALFPTTTLQLPSVIFCSVGGERIGGADVLFVFYEPAESTWRQLALRPLLPTVDARDSLSIDAESTQLARGRDILLGNATIGCAPPPAAAAAAATKDDAHSSLLTTILAQINSTRSVSSILLPDITVSQPLTFLARIYAWFSSHNALTTSASSPRAAPSPPVTSLASSVPVQPCSTVPSVFVPSSRPRTERRLFALLSATTTWLLGASLLLQAIRYRPAVRLPTHRRSPALASLDARAAFVTALDRLAARLLDIIMGVALAFWLFSRAAALHDALLSCYLWVDRAVGLATVPHFAIRAHRMLPFKKKVLVTALDSIRANPIGLKLNEPLLRFLATAVECVIAVHRSATVRLLTSGAFVEVIRASAFVALFGLSLAVGVASDLLALLTMHITAVSAVTARLYNNHLSLLATLFRLLTGRKRNVLRQRIDTCDYDMEQYMLGTLLFTLLLFLLPTVLVFYATFASLSLFVRAARTTLSAAVFIVQRLPVFAVWASLTRYPYLSGGVQFIALYRTTAYPREAPLRSSAAVSHSSSSSTSGSAATAHDRIDDCALLPSTPPRHELTPLSHAEVFRAANARVREAYAAWSPSAPTTLQRCHYDALLLQCAPLAFSVAATDTVVADARRALSNIRLWPAVRAFLTGAL